MTAHPLRVSPILTLVVPSARPSHTFLPSLLSKPRSTSPFSSGTPSRCCKAPPSPRGCSTPGPMRPEPTRSRSPRGRACAGPTRFTAPRGSAVPPVHARPLLRVEPVQRGTQRRFDARARFDARGETPSSPRHELGGPCAAPRQKVAQVVILLAPVRVAGSEPRSSPEERHG